MRFPVNSPYRITQGYSAGHRGIDIAPQVPGTTGVPIYASESGAVVRSGFRANLEGHYIILRGNSGKYYYYGHLARRDYLNNQTVRQGNRIGIMGMTGLATGIHVHYEVRNTLTGGQINPLSHHNNTQQGGTSVTDNQKLTSAPVFDPAWYLNRYADVRRFRNTHAYARQHWLQHGLKEGRQSNANFDVKQYRANYADLRRVFGSDYRRIALHWFNNGIKEGRKGTRHTPTKVVTQVVDTSSEVIDKIVNYAKGLKK